MKVCHIAPTFLPSRRANTIQVMKMAQATAALGYDVKVLVPNTEGIMDKPSWENLAHHYGLQQTFDIDWVSVLPQFRSYDYGIKSVLTARHWGADLIYTRLPQAAAIASTFCDRSIFEVHDLPQGRLGPWLLNRFLKGKGALRLVVITQVLRDDLSLGNFPTVITPDGVDLERYENLPGSNEARKILVLPDQFTVGYTGHLYSGRGADVLLALAKRLPEISFLLVGGNSSDVEQTRQKVAAQELENVTLTGFIPNVELPQYQAACDVLLMPYQRKVAASSGGDISRYLSPMKVFEYLACGRPIVSSDLPVLRETLNEKNAILLPPDDLDAWQAALQELQDNPVRRELLGKQARQDALNYSWESRARKVLRDL